MEEGMPSKFRNAEIGDVQFQEALEYLIRKPFHPSIGWPLKDLIVEVNANIARYRDMRVEIALRHGAKKIPGGASFGANGAIPPACQAEYDELDNIETEYNFTPFALPEFTSGRVPIDYETLILLRLEGKIIKR
jgi:hypothetical protein